VRTLLQTLRTLLRTLRMLLRTLMTLLQVLRTLLQTLRTAVCGFHVISLSWTSLPTEYSCTEPNLTPTTR